jgi:hypothetical protein
MQNPDRFGILQLCQERNIAIGVIASVSKGFLRLPWMGAWEWTLDLLISFIFSFHHFAAETQWLPNIVQFFVYTKKDV